MNHFLRRLTGLDAASAGSKFLCEEGDNRSSKGLSEGADQGQSADR